MSYDEQQQEITRQIEQVRARAESLIETRNKWARAGLDTRAHQLEIEKCVERDIELSAILRSMGLQS